MSHVIKSIMAVAFLGVLSACSSPQPEEVVIVEPAPVFVEPVSTKF